MLSYDYEGSAKGNYCSLVESVATASFWLYRRSHRRRLRGNSNSSSVAAAAASSHVREASSPGLLRWQKRKRARSSAA